MNDHTPPKAPRTPALGDSSGWHLVPYTYDSAGDVHPMHGAAREPYDRYVARCNAQHEIDCTQLRAVHR